MNQLPQTTNSQTLRSLHCDFIHDISFDWYGRRIATCSGDRTVKVWDLDDNNDWIIHPGSDWQAHKSAVNRISWSHPEFGQLLATCGNDRTTTVWEERDTPFDMPNDAQKRWVAKVQLCDARQPVTCVEFAPRHWGLKLATGGADGDVRIYEAIDVANLNQWVMDGCIEGRDGGGVTCLSWCQSRFEPAGMVVGRMDGKVTIHRFNDASRQWCEVLELGCHNNGVWDVAWAPNVGRSFHLIASAGRDGVLKVWRLKRRGGAKGGGLELESGRVLETGDSEVLRVGWNVTGSVLVCSGNKGVVKLWKSDTRGNWRCVSEVHGDAPVGEDLTTEDRK